METYTAVDKTAAKAPTRYSEDQYKSSNVFTNKYTYARNSVMKSEVNSDFSLL